MKKIFAICAVTLLVLTFISQAHAQNVLLKLSTAGTLPSETLIGGVQVEITVPAGVTPVFENGSTTKVNAILSGVAAVAGVHGEAGWNQGTRIVTFALATTDGIGVGEFVTIPFTAPAGALPAFSLNTIAITDPTAQVDLTPGISLTSSRVRAPFLADFDLDGNSDILWRNTTDGNIATWFLNGTTQIGAATFGSAPYPTWQIAGTGDFNNDTKTDILWRNTTDGNVAAWFMDGTTQIGAATFSSAPYPTWQIAGTGDFNNDGYTDILWRNTSDGNVATWFLNGTTQIGAATFGNAPYPTWQIAGTGDFNNDGNTDILWRNTSDGNVAAWFLNGTTQIGASTFGNAPYPTWQIAGTGDFNKDNHTDILWRNTSDGNVAAWFMDGTTQIGAATFGNAPYPTWQILGN